MDSVSTWAPAHEFAPANCYEAELVAYNRGLRVAQVLTHAIQVAFGHADRKPYLPGRAEFESHVHDVHEFARLARRCLESDAGWQPTCLYLRWLRGRAVRWDEVLECLGGERKVA